MHRGGSRCTPGVGVWTRSTFEGRSGAAPFRCNRRDGSTPRYGYLTPTRSGSPWRDAAPMTPEGGRMWVSAGSNSVDEWRRRTFARERPGDAEPVGRRPRAREHVDRAACARVPGVDTRTRSKFEGRSSPAPIRLYSCDGSTPRYRYSTPTGSADV